jgi:hypothetical protein
MNIITIDYELFGSGKGCVFKHIIEPTERMLKLFDKHAVKATFFVEILEVEALIALKESYPPLSMEHKAAVALEQQLDSLARQGHDIQLHLHPQWHEAKYSNGKWQLNHQWWSFADLPYRTSETAPGQFDLIAKSKALLEKRIRRIKPDYSCMAFRAGGYNIGNQHASIKALIENDIVLDSSVCPGFFSNSLSNYDFTAAPELLSHWYCAESVNIPVAAQFESSLLELPLLTIHATKVERFSIARVFSALKNRSFKGVPYNPNREDKKAEIPANFKNSNFDICLSSRQEISRFMQIIKQKRAEEPNFPLVLIGHPKDYSRFSPLEKIIKLKSIKFKSIQEIANYV